MIIDDNEIAELLQHGCTELQLALQPEQLQQLQQHLILLRHWNNRINLTAITEPKKMVVEHVLDSLAIYPYLKGKNYLDIGSGAGFPGIPLAIAFANTQWTLLDSRQKKVAFLNHVAMQLKLNNVTTITKRVENQNSDAFFDTLVARAFSSVSDLVTRTQKLQTKGVRLLALKGRAFENELENLSGCLQDRIIIKKITVPFLKAERNLIIIDF